MWSYDLLEFDMFAGVFQASTNTKNYLFVVNSCKKVFDFSVLKRVKMILTPKKALVVYICNMYFVLSF